MSVGIYLHGCIGDNIHASTAFWNILVDNNFPKIYFLSSCTGRPDIVELLVRDTPGMVDFEFKDFGCGRFRRQHNYFKRFAVDKIYDLCPFGSGIWDGVVYKRISTNINRIPRPFDPWFYNNLHVEKYLDHNKRNVVIHRYTGWHNIYNERNLVYPKWKQVTELLKDWGYKVILIGDDDPYEINSAIDLNLIKETNVLESLSLVRMADLFVGIISGTFHYSRFYHATIGFSPPIIKRELDHVWFTNGLESTKDFVRYFDTADEINKDKLDNAIRDLIHHDRMLEIKRDVYLLQNLGEID